MQASPRPRTPAPTPPRQASVEVDVSILTEAPERLLVAATGIFKAVGPAREL